MGQVEYLRVGKLVFSIAASLFATVAFGKKKFQLVLSGHTCCNLINMCQATVLFPSQLLMSNRILCITNYKTLGKSKTHEKWQNIEVTVIE